MRGFLLFVMAMVSLTAVLVQGGVEKWVLVFAMIAGRLEIFTILVLLTPRNAIGKCRFLNVVALSGIGTIHAPHTANHRLPIHASRPLQPSGGRKRH